MPLRLVLSLDGGGARGVFLVSLLYCLHQEVQAWGAQWHDCVDLIVGTSIGAVVGALVATRRSNRLSEFLAPRAAHLFVDPTCWDRILPIQAQAKYDGAVKAETLNRIFGDERLADVAVPLAVPTYDLHAHAPVLHKSWEEPGGQLRLRHLLAAATAAPTYFPAVPLKDERGQVTLHIDGGVALQNPSPLAYLEGRRRFPNDALLLLSVGTGKSLSFREVREANWGFPQWANHGLLDIMMMAPTDMNHALTQQFMAIDGNVQCVRLDSSLEGIDCDDDRQETQDRLVAEGRRVYALWRSRLVPWLQRAWYERKPKA